MLKLLAACFVGRSDSLLLKLLARPLAWLHGFIDTQIN
jgi:hypothetical protein